ncbi:MAG: diguanylate cyclase [Deltaproteobacteria bacterium]|jgi:diguanylate cyclase (GGDEF)-like protein|nr:diguanylate cyclase [Deltaproteobacteria bacterium]
MALTKVLLIDHYGPDFGLISKALRPFGCGLMWTETLEDGLDLLREAKPAVVLVSDRLPGLISPTNLLKIIQAQHIPAQIIVMSSQPDFDLAMDWVTEGIFAVIKTPINTERLGLMTARILENQKLFSSMVDQASSLISPGELYIYKNLAGHLEPGHLLQALCDTARKMTGAALTEAWVESEAGDNQIFFSGALAGLGDARLNLPLNWMGRPLGALCLRFEDPADAAKVDQAAIDELVYAGSLFLGQAVRFEEAIKMATRDPLTGLSNRRIFLETIEREFRQARRHNSPLSLLTLDLDHFKTINDTYGHQAGDEILKWLASVVASVVRSGDLPARIGGEEFAIILPRTTIEQATNLAQRLQEGMLSSPIYKMPDLAKPTISQGIASLEHFLVNSTQDLIYWSDQAMYLAKREGRNTIRTISQIQGKTNFQDVQYAFQ